MLGQKHCDSDGDLKDMSKHFTVHLRPPSHLDRPKNSAFARDNLSLERAPHLCKAMFKHPILLLFVPKNAVLRLENLNSNRQPYYRVQPWKDNAYWGYENGV